MDKNIQKTESVKREIDQLRPFSDSLNATIQEKLRVEWTYHSNAIEGNTLTLGETAFYLREGLTSEGKPLKDYVEARNHAEAIDGLNKIVRTAQPITESMIKSLHGVLMRGIDEIRVRGGGGHIIGKPMRVGDYKQQPNHVLTLSGEVHSYTEPLFVPDEMQQLVQWVNDDDKLHPIERAAAFHYRFVSIHPFDDGNGRMSRLLMNILLMQAGYLPCVIRNERRRQYLEALEQVDQTGDEALFVSFVAEELLHTLQQILSVVTGEQAVHRAQLQRLTPQQRRDAIIGVLRRSKNAMSISQLLERLPSMRRPTMKKDLQQLVVDRSIRKEGVGKGTTYTVGEK
jgi:Fic family protein